MESHSFKALNWQRLVLTTVMVGLVVLGSASPINAQSPSTFISAPNRADVVYDQGRHLLYITSGAEVLRYDLAARQFLPPFELGGNLKGIDLSPDGNTIVVADETYSNTQIWVYLINLQTGASQKQAFPITSAETWGTWAVAYANDGTILLSESNQWSPLRKVNPATGTTTVLLNAISGATALSSSADGSVIGFAQGSSTSGPWGWYRVSDNHLAQQQTGTNELNYEIATNRNGSQFAIPTLVGTFVYNSGLSNITTLWQPPAGSLQPQGAVYDPIKDILYLSWGGTQEVRAFETTNFTQVGTFNFGATFRNTGMSQTYETGRLKISRDGALIFAIVDGGVSYLRLIPDTTPPVIVPSINPPPNANGWNNTNPTVSWTVSDPESGLFSSNGCGSQTLTSEASDTTLTCSATNGVGLSATQSVTVKVDKTAPVMSIGFPAPNANGWYNSSVTVMFGCSDALSGVDTYSAPTTVSTEGPNQSVTGTCVDKAGNTSSISYGRINIDKTPPTITGAPTTPANASGWYNSNVVVHFTASDALSGVDTITPDQTLTNEGAAQSVSGTATDKAGNSSTITVNNINIDKTPPTISIASPQAISYVHTATFTATWSASDSLSGIAASSGNLDGQIVTNGKSVDLFFLSLGAHTLKVNASDKAGNAASSSVVFNVVADINSLMAATKRACSLSWIKEKRVCVTLDAMLIGTKEAIEHNRTQVAKQLLNAFIKTLDGQKGKAINQQAYDLLKADALYVIATLH